MLKQEKMTKKLKKLLVPSDIPQLLQPGRTVLLPGKILVKPHGTLIWKGKKKAIVSSRKFTKYIGIPVYLIEDNKALGIIEIKEGRKINLRKFKELRKFHQISEDERKRWWSKEKFLYYYPIELISKFDPPKEILRPKGAQVWLENVTFKSMNFGDPAKLSDEELLKLHREIHKIWQQSAASKEDCINYHILLKDEILKRKLEYEPFDDDLDKEAKKFKERFSKEGYKVTFYGTKGLIEEEGPGHRFHTSILYEYKGKRLLVDYGKINQGNLEKIKPDYILVSHSHPDHLLGLKDMAIIVSKETEKEVPNLYKDFNIDARTKYESYKTFNLGPFKITPIPVLHSIRAKMHVFLIEMGDKRVLQATDILGWHSGDREKYVKDLDLAIIDGSSLTRTLARRKGKKGEPYGHSSLINQLKNWYLPGKVKRIVVTHLGKEPLSYGDDVLLTKIRELTKVPIIIATDNIVINLSEGSAPIYTSGKRMGKLMILEEILPYFKDFIIQRPLIYLTGGIVNQGSTRGDLDILLPEWLSFDMRRIIEFRIARSVPWWIRRRLHFVYDKFSTPFTNAIPLYNLVMLRSKDRMLRLSDFEKQLREKPRVTSAIKDAEVSAREDKIKLFRFFLPLKPTRGYYPEKRQSIDLFIEVMENMGKYPFYSTKKYDGFNAEIHKKGEEVKIFSEDGEVITHRLPTLVKEVKQLTKEDCVLMAELEWWEDNDHKPREVIAGYIHQKGIPDDSHVVANVYDMPYFKVDIHNEPFEKRLKLLESLPFKQRTWKIPNIKIKLNFAPYLLSKNREKLRKHTEFLRRLPGSEGNVCKTKDFKFNLKGIRSGMVKFHNSTAIYGKVLDIKETKVKGVYNYYFGLEPGKYKMKTEELGNVFYHRSGRTFSTSLKADKGDVLEIEGETLNVEHDLKDDTWRISLWAPRVMRKVNRKADTVKEAIERAKKNYCLQEKEITKEGKIIYLSELEKIKDIKYNPKIPNNKQLADDWRIVNAWYSRIKEGNKFKYTEKQVISLARIIYNEIKKRVKEKRMKHEFEPQKMKKWSKKLYEKVSKELVEKQHDPYMEYPKVEKKYPYVIQHHYRLKSCHSDLRIKQNNYLLGWTIADMVKGAIKEPVTTMKQAKELDSKDIWKIDWKKGVPKLRPGIKPGYKKKYAELAAMRKSAEPIEWLNVEGIVPVGSPGATKTAPGVFHIIDKGYCQYGAQKPYFHEYFFSGGKLKGRWFFRQLRPAEFRGKIEKQEVIPPARETKFREEAPWFLVKPLDETPYVISDAAVDKKWIPPKEVSALPEKIRKKVPKEFQYWKFDDEKKRIEVRDKLVEKLGKVLVEKKLNPGANWAKAAYRYILSQQILTFWLRTPYPEKVKRVEKALQEFKELHPFKKEWLKDAITWLEKRPNDMKMIMIELLQVKKIRIVPFVLQRHWWRGQRVIRAGVSREHWDLRFNFPDQPGLMHFVLNQNPLKNKEVTALWKPCKYKEWMEVSQYLPPKNERAKMSKEELAKLPPGIEDANPTKATSSYIKIIDKGKAVVYEDSDSFKKFEFKGEKLKGLWVLERENTSNFWVFKETKLPRPK
ncbi:MAG: ATP-dependent DNA ligase [Candidatus Hodarchaeales archaeon]